MSILARVLCLVLLAGLAERSGAGPILGASVSFNPTTALFTYDYALDNRTGPATINELSVLINSRQRDGLDGFLLEPLARTDPPGWDFALTFSGAIQDPPFNEFGTFWRWNSSAGLPVGATLSGFSFTTDRGPASGVNNNYFLFSATLGGDGIAEFGRTLAPDFAPVAVPEPSTLALLGLGAIAAALIGAYIRRRNRR